MAYLDNLYPQVPNIDGRDQFERLLRGDVGVIAIGRDAILRRMTDQNCACWDGVTGGPVAFCSYCLGEGFTFTEEMIQVFVADGTAPLYKPGVLGSGQYPWVNWGIADPSKSTGFTSWFYFPNYERYTFREQKHFDKLLLLKVDGEGATMYPQVTTAKFKVMNVIPRHGDSGKVEHIELALEKENTT
jgi:hypothetical protein